MAVKVYLSLHFLVGKKKFDFKCEVCDRSFTCSKYLENHQRIHTGDRPFRCDICDKSFDSTTPLKSHMATHTKGRRYKCDECDKNFMFSWNLKIHKRTHTGERPYACDFCDKRFTQSGVLKRHRQKHLTDLAKEEANGRLNLNHMVEEEDKINSILDANLTFEELCGNPAVKRKRKSTEAGPKPKQESRSSGALLDYSSDESDPYPEKVNSSAQLEGRYTFL